MHNHLVSIIVPVYNGEKHIRETLDSILAQTISNFEVIMVNDGSKDQSANIISEFLLDSRLHYIEQTNAGVAEARNTGIRAAKGEYIALLDQDDIWKPEKLALQLNYFDQHPKCALVHSQIGFINETGEPLPTPEWAWVSETYGDSLKILFEHNRIATFTVLFRKSVLENIGGFRENFAPSDDWDLWLRIADQYELGFIPQISGSYRIHANNESRNLIRMQLAEVSVIENFLCEFLGTKKKIDSQTKKTKLFQLYCETAELFEHKNQPDTSVKYWKKALSQKPLSFKCHLKTLWNQLPSRYRINIRWYVARIITFIKKIGCGNL